MLPNDPRGKAGLRRDFLRARLGLGAEREALGARAQQALIDHPVFREARSVMVYLAFRGEVPTTLVVRACLEDGKLVSAPVTFPKEGRLVPLRLEGRPGELREGAYGITEPDPSVCRPVPPSELDLVVVPGVAFDERSGRIGYGGGYYDRFLRWEAARAVRAALAYEVQISAEPLPLGPFDVRMDFIFTPERVLRGHGRRGETAGVQAR